MFKYSNKKEKILDFIIGILINTGIVFLYKGLFYLIDWGSNVVILILEIYLLIKFQKINRKYILIGMLSFLLIPLLLTGMCFVIFSGF